MPNHLRDEPAALAVIEIETGRGDDLAQVELSLPPRDSPLNFLENQRQSERDLAFPGAARAASHTFIFS
jgi:hypothetical protein